MFEIVTSHGPELRQKVEKLAPRVYVRIADIVTVFVLFCCLAVLLIFKETLMAVLGLLVFLLFRIRFLLSKRKVNQAQSAVRTITTVFDADGITSLPSDGDKSVFSYDQILGVYDSESFIVLEINKGTIALDKAGFQKGTPEELLEFLAPKTEQKTKARKRKYLIRAILVNLIGIVLVALYLFSAKAARSADADRNNAPEKSQHVQTIISINDTTQVDVSDRIEEAQKIIYNGRLLNPNAAVLSLGEDVYISLSLWGDIPTTEATYYLPMLIYRENDGWETSWYGDYSVDLSGSDPSTRHAAGAFFAQRAGEKTVINVGTRYLKKQNADSSLLLDSLGRSPAELSASLVGGVGDKSVGWIIMSSLSSEIQFGTPQFVAMTPMEHETGLIFVVQDLADDYLIQCGEWKITGAEIRACLENPDFSSDSVR